MMNKINNLPLSSNQKQLWIIEQQNTENPAYNVSFTYNLKGAIDAGIFNRSIQILFDRQHSLFSVFRQSDGILYIDIIPREVKVELMDFSDISAEKRRAEILSFAGADAGKWFDLEKGPLYRLYLLKYDDSEYYFHATIHHIVFDGWSRQIFVDELSSIYTDLHMGEEFSLKPIEYHSYDLAGQDVIAESERNSEKMKKFWTDNLKGFNNNALNLPSDRQRPEHSTGLGQVEFFIIPENVITRLRELAGNKMRSLFQIMASTLGLFLHKVTGDDDICIGIPVSKRVYKDKMAHLIGFFVETTVVRYRFDPGTSIIDFIDHAGNIVWEAVRNSAYSFDRIVETLNPPRIPGVNPYFQVTLSWMTGMTNPMDLCGIRGEKIIPDRNVTPFDLAFFMSEKENTLEVELIYSSDLFNKETIQQLIANYLKLLDVATHEPHSLLSSFNIISDRELKRISTSNETTAARPAAVALVENNAGSSSNNENDLSFWKETLKDCPSFLKLPYDFKRPETNSGKGSYETVILAGEITKKLRALSGSVNASLFSSMLGITGIFLSKLTGESDINIGLPVAYRPHSKLERIFGMFVNTVVVRLLFSNELSFRDLLKLSHSVTLDAVAHSSFPFKEIVRATNPERMTNVNPLFQAAFLWQNDFNIPLNTKDPVCEILKPNIRTVPFDIIFSFHEEGDAVIGEIEYSIDLFRRETILNMKEIFVELVERLVNVPDTPIVTVPVISEQGIRKIESFNNTRTSYPSERTIAGLFKDQVVLYSDKEAVVFRGVSMTYRDLDLLSDKIASTLRASGHSGNSPVAIFGDKSPEVIAAIIGILKAGGIYVPVDPEYPEDRISFILSDSGSRIVLVQKKYAKHKFENITKIEIPADYHLSDGSGIKEKEVFYAESAYIMYTSGTTGNPKGSLIPQRGIIRLVRNTNYIDLTQEERILMTGVLVFDASTFEIWGALLNGGTLYIAEKETILDPDALGRELLENNITIMWLTSGLFTQIAEIRTDIFKDLKYLLVGGDVLSVPHINKVRRDHPQLKVINGYGPTENTTFSITCLIDREYDHSIPIGRPVSNSTAYIFDSKMNLLPPGIVGELYVGGDGLSTGYLNRDDLNSVSFMDHPYKPGERIYRTGDHARWLPDGNIEFHGRIDNQVKIRGYRVEPDEIEAAISDIDEVVETVVKHVKTESGDVRLIAFLNVTEKFSSTEDALRKKLKAKLPSYMIPSAFSIMKGFPKTINGKTDRKALVYNINDIIPPAAIEEVTFTPSEKTIYDIWSDALKKRDISLTDNFFDIGGNSLMAISVFSKIQKAFNKDLHLRLFFDSPRIKDIAETFDLMSSDKTVKSKSRRSLSKDAQMIIKGEIF